MAKIMITTTNSINVKPLDALKLFFIIFFPHIIVSQKQGGELAITILAQYVAIFYMHKAFNTAARSHKRSPSGRLHGLHFHQISLF